MGYQLDKVCPNCKKKRLVKIGFILRCTCGWWVYLEETNRLKSEQAIQTESQTIAMTSS